MKKLIAESIGTFCLVFADRSHHYQRHDQWKCAASKGICAQSMKKRVLFVCVHNSSRSQMAEALLSQMCGAAFEAESAGLEPGILNPLAVEVLREIGIDIAGKKTRAVSDVIESGERFDYVITVCDESSAEKSPLFPGGTMRLHWSLPDPAKFQGSWEERLKQTRKVRDEIEPRFRN